MNKIGIVLVRYRYGPYEPYDSGEAVTVRGFVPTGAHTGIGVPFSTRNAHTSKVLIEAERLLRIGTSTVLSIVLPSCICSIIMSGHILLLIEE